MQRKKCGGGTKEIEAPDEFAENFEEKTFSSYSERNL